jgi:putative flavoprotein involved in K+ transport
MADYLESYATRFALPVRSGVRVNRLSRIGNRFLAVAGDRRFEADQVVIAMAQYQRPRVPGFARELRSGIVQLHSLDYRNPAQLQPGDVLIVGLGNSGAEIAIETVRSHRVWLSGKSTGEVPFRMDGLASRLVLSRLVLRLVFHRLLSIATPIGRAARPRLLHKAAPLIRTRLQDLTAAGIQRVSRVVGVRDGLPLLDDGRVLDVANVIWCTGFDPGFSWVDLPIFDANGEPRHHAGVAQTEPGLYFVGLHFQYAFSSDMIHGIGRDAARIADLIAARVAGHAVSGTSEPQVTATPASA